MITKENGFLDPTAYWDSQLKFSSILPEFQVFLDRMAADSRKFSEGRNFQTITTGPDPRQWVEWAKGIGQSQTIPILIHGGYWRALRAEDHRFMMAPILETAAAVGSIEYRLKPVFSMRDIVEDVRNGLHAMTQQFPKAKFVLIGHSAGAHLSIFASKDQSLSTRIAGIIALSGVYDLFPVAASSLQKEIGFTPDEVVDFSLEPAETYPAVVYINGAEETYELTRGSMKMATRGNSKVIILPNANHMTLTWTAMNWLAGECVRVRNWDSVFEP